MSLKQLMAALMAGMMADLMLADLKQARWMLTS
jgi:hypothetical protein